MVSFGAGAVPPPPRHGWGFPRAGLGTVFSLTSGPGGPSGPQRRAASPDARAQPRWGRGQGDGSQGSLAPRKLLPEAAGRD